MIKDRSSSIASQDVAGLWSTEREDEGDEERHRSPPSPDEGVDGAWTRCTDSVTIIFTPSFVSKFRAARGGRRYLGFSLCSNGLIYIFVFNSLGTIVSEGTDARVAQHEHVGIIRKQTY